MKLDTSSYYPKSPLDDDNEPEGTSAQHVESATVTEAVTHENMQAANGAHVQITHDEEDRPPTETEEAVTKLSEFLSLVFVPLLMPVYGTILAFTLSLLAYTGAGTKLAFIAIVAGFNVVIPAIVVLFLKKAGVVNDLGLNNQKERFLPYVVCVICLIGTALFMHFRGAPAWLVMFFLGGAAAGIAEAIINRWWKISVHSAGIAGIVALIMHLYVDGVCTPSTFTWLLISIGVAGLLGSARIWLGRHTLWQVLAGYAVGFCAVYFIMMA